MSLCLCLLSALVLIRSDCSESVHLHLLCFGKHLRGHNLDSLQERTKPKDVLRECLSYIPAADYRQSMGSVSHHSTMKPQMPVLYCWIFCINYFTLQPLSTELLMPITGHSLSLSRFLSKFFFTFLHLNLKPRCPNSCRSVSESLRDSVFVDNGPQQPGWRRSFCFLEFLATAFSG